MHTAPSSASLWARLFFPAACASRVTPRRFPGRKVARCREYALMQHSFLDLIGRTPTRVFDAGRTSPYLLRAGDRVRFVPITPRQYERERRAVR